MALLVPLVSPTIGFFSDSPQIKDLNQQLFSQDKVRVNYGTPARKRFIKYCRS
ncbi:hypothetical protein H1P_130045 [Hyella patelloides LEGE 07179]|uniref:Uncharacterized protein n=1 Tax=Hyella patelloides LEGE 07179 TaxID=945734 RepID=A0A563VL40_9CYAN|nr:hypothetical protein H1P_130045 [Hyella patelloides LEGE 07179]